MKKGKIYIKNIVIIVTTQCNLSCDCCMRGEPEKYEVFNPRLIKLLPKFMEKFKSNMITFSGGEPMLRQELICKIINTIDRKLNSSYFIKTNGYINIRDELLSKFIKIVARERKENCYDSSMIVISNEYYHKRSADYIGLEERPLDILTGLGFNGDNIILFDNKKTKEEYYPSYINEGNAKINGIGQREKESLFDCIYINDHNDDIEVSEVTIDCQGRVFAGCNHSYESMNISSKYFLGYIGDIKWLSAKIHAIASVKKEKMQNEMSQ